MNINTLKNESEKPALLKGSRNLTFSVLRFIVLLSTVLWIVVLVIAGFGAAPLLSDAFILNDSIELMPTLGFTAMVFLGGILVLVILLGTASVLRKIKTGESPFDKSVVYKTRLLAVLLIIYGIVDSLFRSYFSTLFANGLYNLDPFSDSIAFSMTQPYWFPEFNVGALVAGLVVLVISFVFEYGNELQDESDSFL